MRQQAGLGNKRMSIHLAILCLFSVGAAQETGGNIVVNPAFEQSGSGLPDGWSGDPEVYSRDPDGGRAGASLRYSNTDAKRYRLCSQRVPVQAGRKYRFSVWIKTRDIAGDENGATICLEWRGANNKWLGGDYPHGIQGTQDWKRIEGVVRVPDDAAAASLSCYVRQGMTGTAWFDDVELVRVADPPLETFLVEPVYRGRISASGPAQIRLQGRLNLGDHELMPQQVQLSVQLRTADGTLQEQQRITPQSDSFEASVATASLKPGNYSLEVRLEGPDGKEIQRVTHPLVRTGDGHQPRACIDEHKRLLFDGQPFFPLGMYWGSIDEQDLSLYAQSRFNCLMPYNSPTREQMGLAQKYGLKVIYSVKDWYVGSTRCPKSIKSPEDEESAIRKRVSEFRDHPALLAWYLNDELPLQFLPQLEAHQRWVAEEDPQHPTWVVLFQYRDVFAYRHSFDVIGTDPYPIGRKPASMAAEWTAETSRQVRGGRAMWQVPQLHNWVNYRKASDKSERGRTPSFEEVRSMAWQCIAEGATGLVFYSWYDVKRNPDVPFDKQWEGLKKIAAEIDGLSPALLSIEPAPAIQVVGQSPRWLHWIVRSHRGRSYLIAVNDGDGEGPVEFRLPFVPKAVRELSRGKPADAGNSLHVDLPRLDVQLYELTPPSAE
jgi:hypothetical protein